MQLVLVQEPEQLGVPVLLVSQVPETVVALPEIAAEEMVPVKETASLHEGVVHVSVVENVNAPLLDTVVVPDILLHLVAASKKPPAQE
jgi:hypothetical protein